LVEQKARVDAGFHMMQTDYPWIYYSDKGYSQPFRPINPTRFPDSSVFVEPGNRIFISTDSEKQLSVLTDENFTDWETLPSSTRSSPNEKFPNTNHVYGKGCLVAESNRDNSVRVCREVNHQQNAVISIETTENGKLTTESFISNERTCGKVGDYIRLTIGKSKNDKGSCVNVYSSSEMMNGEQTNFIPKWNLLYTKCFNHILNRQGISAVNGDVLFTGTRKNGNYVKSSDLTESNK
jgi:hypothetical protein